VVVVAKVVLRAGGLGARLVTLGQRMRGRIGAVVLLGRGRLLLGLRVMLLLLLLLLLLLVNDTRGSRVEVLLGRRRTLLLVVGMMHFAMGASPLVKMQYFGVELEGKRKKNEVRE
jgi:uncharacterized integral membrane protein